MGSLNVHHRSQVRKFAKLHQSSRNFIIPTASWFRFFLFPTIRRHRQLLVVSDISDYIHRIIWSLTVHTIQPDPSFCFLTFRSEIDYFRNTERNRSTAHRGRIERTSIEILYEVLVQVFFIFSAQTSIWIFTFFNQFSYFWIFLTAIHQLSFLVR